MWEKEWVRMRYRENVCERDGKKRNVRERESEEKKENDIERMCAREGKKRMWEIDEERE